MSKTIVVFGATGKQGNSVISSLLNDKETADKFHIKAVSRDPSKESAKALASKGVEVVSVCMNPPNSSDDKRLMLMFYV